MTPLVADQPRLAADSTGTTIELDPSWLESTKHPQTGLLSRSIVPEEAGGPLAEIKTAVKQFQLERLDAIRRDPEFKFYFRKSDADFPTVADLHRNPEAYHGRLVTFRGHVRRLISSPPRENSHGLQQLHEAWL